MELKTKEKIIENLKMAAQMLDWDVPSRGDWICAVDIVQNTLADMILRKREAFEKLEKEKPNVEG